MNADDFVGGHSILALERFMGFTVIASFSMDAGDSEYVTEYRVYKGSGWTDSEISLDLEDLVAAENASATRPRPDVPPLLKRRENGRMLWDQSSSSVATFAASYSRSLMGSVASEQST